MLTFPKDWPKNCPPWNALDAQGVVYRIVAHEAGARSDFLTHAELGTAIKAPPCLRHGLSVFRSLEDARHMRVRYPVLGAYIATGQLQPSYGRTRPTPRRGDSHTTWWVYRGVDRAAIFAVVNEDSK